MKVSVCIATYNGEKFIRCQLESILSQLSLIDEIVISDNCSTDSTRDIINSFSDPRIILHSCDTRNLVLNFENSFGYVTGDVVIVADQDDVWLDGKVQRIKLELENFDLVVTDCMVVDEQLNLLHSSLFLLIQPKLGLIKNLMRNSYTGCCMAFNRKVLDAALPFPRGLPMHDWWLGLVGEIVGTVKFINDPYLLYRRHGANASTLSLASKFSPFKKIIFRWFMVKNLFIRFVIQSRV